MDGKKERLKSLLRQKRSVLYYAVKLEVSTQQIEEWKQEIADEEAGLTISGPNSQTIKVDHDKGTYHVDVYYNYPPSEEDIIRDHKIDMTKYTLSAFYTKGKAKGWQVTALFKLITEEQTKANDFMEFLKTYKPSFKGVSRDTKHEYLGPGALIINKQDAHLNKKCEYGTGNDIHERFDTYELGIKQTIARASKLANIERATYIIGSDHFNSEVTGATVKGTPQVNILNYHTSFQLICEHEVNIIGRLLQASDEVEVIYLLGNHDATVSFHMASWLKAYFRNETRLKIDISPEFTKYFNLFDTAVCINHGDVQKPERLAQNFPLEYKKGFFMANHHIILTGDKHTELTRDIGGIKFYQIPAISKAKGAWDKQSGYTTNKSQITSFLIEPDQGVSTILKITL